MILLNYIFEYLPKKSKQNENEKNIFLLLEKNSNYFQLPFQNQ